MITRREMLKRAGTMVGVGDFDTVCDQTNRTQQVKCWDRAYEHIHVGAYVGPFIPYNEVVALAGKQSRSEQYRAITYHVEGVIRRLAPRAQAWTLGDAGTMPMAEYLQAHGAAPVPSTEDEARE